MQQELLNQEKMMQVVRAMKQIPELPSEAPKDVQPLEKVEFPEQGGVLTYMGGQPLPYKGFPFFEFVDKIDILKKISRAVLSGLYHELKTKRLLFVTLIPVLWLIKPMVRTFLYVIYRVIDRFKLKEEKYCDAVREVYRAFTSDDEFENMFRDLLCMVLEFDNAYRYRFQDVIVNLDKEVLKVAPKLEILKLLKILSERERGQDIKDTWYLVKLALSFYLLVDRQFKKMLVRSLYDLDLSKVELKIEDKLYCSGRKDYLFSFMLKHDVDGDKCLKFNKIREEHVDRRFNIQEESTKKHQELFVKHEEAQKLIANHGDEEQIRKEINEKVDALYNERDAKIKEIAEIYANSEREIMLSYLTDEQKDLGVEQQKEAEQMNKEFETLLLEEDEKYKLLCQSIHFI